MKKKALTIAISAIAMGLALCIPLSACSSDDGGFINPGDNLGGGGTASPTDEVDSSASDNEISSAGNKDLSDLLDGSSDDAATALMQKDVQITSDGSYSLSGSYSSVYIAKGLTVNIYLDGATISPSDGEGLYSEKGCSVTLTLSGENTISGGEYNAVHIKGDLSVNGDGILNAVSEGKSAIKASKSLNIAGATLNLTGGSHGAEAESISAYSATVNVLSAAKDGLHAECDYDESSDSSECVFTTEAGYISLKDVAYTSSTYGDGISADTFIYIDGGSYSITTTGEFVAKSSENMKLYSLESTDFRYTKSGSAYKKVDSDVMGASSLYALKQSCKGIKVGYIKYDSDGDGEDDVTVTDDTNYYIMICGGAFDINSADDAVHSNGGNIVIDGGEFNITTLDDGFTADSLLKINDGTIDIESSYEGLEGAYIEVNGGEITVIASDDGFNAASELSPSDMHIIVAGGTITVNAEGDGFDSNGSILISGGDVTVYGPTTGGNGGLDSYRGIMVTGGRLFVSSALGMVETPATNSTQYVLSLATQSNMSGGSTLTIESSDGEEIFSVEIAKNCQSVIISLPDFEKGETYTAYINGSSLSSFTISSIITSVGSTGGSNMGGNNGGNNGGGMSGNRPGGRR